MKILTILYIAYLKFDIALITTALDNSLLERADLEARAIRTQIETATTANVLIDSSLEVLKVLTERAKVV